MKYVKIIAILAISIIILIVLFQKVDFDKIRLALVSSDKIIIIIS